MAEQPPAPAGAPPKPMGHFRVTVERWGVELVTIEPRLLTGNPDLTDEDRAAIREAAEHLIAFAGAPPASPAPVARPDVLAAEEVANIEQHIAMLLPADYLARIGADAQAPSHKRELHHRCMRIFADLAERLQAPAPVAERLMDRLRDIHLTARRVIARPEKAVEFCGHIVRWCEQLGVKPPSVLREAASPAPVARPATVYDSPAQRLRWFVRQHALGGCKVLSDTDCTCPLCDVDRLTGAAPQAPVPVADPAQDGVALIAAERQRQVSAEGWTPEHDDSHTDGVIAGAAACLAVEGTDGEFTWPGYEASWIKALRDKHERSPRVRQLAIAGALIAAEIDRVQRLAASPAHESPAPVAEREPTREELRQALDAAKHAMADVRTWLDLPEQSEAWHRLNREIVAAERVLHPAIPAASPAHGTESIWDGVTEVPIDELAKAAGKPDGPDGEPGAGSEPR